jgi:pimeloyl-ACP methyl ester carboxylesterase
MLGQTRDTYPPSFIKRLHDEIPNAVVLTIDPRGHGQSTSLGTYDDFGTFEFQAMQNDIVSAKQAITDRYPIAKQYYVVGASIGSTSAIIAGARDRDIVKIAMLSPGMEYQGVDIEDAADTYNRPLLLAAASGDSYSANSVTLIESISTSQVTTKTYSGSAHGTDLFDATKGESEPLDDVILDFLK